MAPTMHEEVITTVRVPKDGLAEELRARHGIKADLFDISMEDDMLVLSFRDGGGGAKPAAAEQKAAPSANGGETSQGKDAIPDDGLEGENWEEEARAAWNK